MNRDEKEIEVKFYLSRLKDIERKVNAMGLKLHDPRVHELNLRFDTPDHSLIQTGRLLRLRMDTRARITYKGTGAVEGGARQREELEFTVSDFNAAQKVLEALDFQVMLMYEKYRTTYTLGAGEKGELEIVLDELPYGNFMEIEGPDGKSIQALAEQLGMDWESRILDSYTMLFENVRNKLGFRFRDLSFENFEGIAVNPEDLGVRVADKE